MSCGVQLSLVYVRLTAFNYRAVRIPRVAPLALRLRLHSRLVYVRALPFFALIDFVSLGEVFMVL